MNCQYVSTTVISYIQLGTWKKMLEEKKNKKCKIQVREKYSQNDGACINMEQCYLSVKQKGAIINHKLEEFVLNLELQEKM